MCKKEICCLEITIAARFVGVVGLVSTLNIKYILETKKYVIIEACCLFTDYISTIKALNGIKNVRLYLERSLVPVNLPNNISATNANRYN
jgi:hypothetical protein